MKKKSENHTLSDRQLGSLVLPLENAEDKEQTHDQVKQRDPVFSSKSHLSHLNHVCHSRIAAFSDEYSSRQGIEEKNNTLESGFFIPTFFKRLFDY